jgi:Zn-dependent M28 family amino/carboxypeptidase
VRAAVSPEAAELILAGAPRSPGEIYGAAEREKPPGSFDLPRRAFLRNRSLRWDSASCNVAGLLEGSDPVLRDEVVVYMAHLDHLGVGIPADGDSIYNGAYDNASGVAVLLEVARAAAGLASPPRRSLLFLAVTGEEKGLLGSEVFAERPTVVPRRVVGSINLDMFLMLHPFLDVVAFGAEHSTMGGAVERAATRMGIGVSPDPIPEEVIFVRSDQYSLVKKGIPSIFLVGGFETGDPARDGKALYEAWNRDVYHRPGDDMTQAIDFEAGARFAETNLRIGLEIADADDPPRWIPGDFFGERFGTGGP